MSFGYSKIQTLDTQRKAVGSAFLFSFNPLYSVQMPYLQCRTGNLLLILYQRNKGKTGLNQLGWLWGERCVLQPLLKAATSMLFYGHCVNQKMHPFLLVCSQDHTYIFCLAANLYDNSLAQQTFHENNNFPFLMCQLLYIHPKSTVTRIPGITRFHRFSRLVASCHEVGDSSQLIFSERAPARRPATSNLIIHLTLRKRRRSIFPAEKGCHEMSHPNLPCNCLELASPKWSPETGLTSLPRGPDWIYLGCWGFILQQLLLEVSTSASFFHRALWNGRSRKMSRTLEQPEATSLQ